MATMHSKTSRGRRWIAAAASPVFLCLRAASPVLLCLRAASPVFLCLWAASPVMAQDGVCAYKPSRVVGSAVAKVGAELEGAGDLAKAGVQAAGRYMLMHPGQSIQMVAGAAGTVSGGALSYEFGRFPV